MSNETLEFIRVLSYIFGIAGLLYVSVVVRKVAIICYTVAGYFAMWAALLIKQIAGDSNYREVANFVSTPSLFVIVVLIYVNLWVVRND